jgi:predicted membrane metal-binding protein
MGAGAGPGGGFITEKTEAGRGFSFQFSVFSGEAREVAPSLVFRVSGLVFFGFQTVCLEFRAAGLLHAFSSGPD